MRKTLIQLSAVSVYLVIGYTAFSFAAWSFDIREWNWILRAFLIALIYVPFNKKSFTKI